jgi:uncharacterized protein (DUF2336 family)
MSQDEITTRAERMLAGKAAGARRSIAAKLGERLAADLSADERFAAEELARLLAKDAIEVVRRALMTSVRNCRFLPRDVALKIAHDVDSISVPFLEVTEVFSEDDLQQLILTISDRARAGVARRPRLPERVATSLAEIGDAYTAQCLVENESTQLGEAALTTLVLRFQEREWLMERLAERANLPPTIVERLIAKVSDAAREKLLTRYRIPDFIEPIVNSAKMSALLQAVRDASEQDLLLLAEAMHQRGELSPILILEALKDNHLAFFEMAMAVREGQSFGVL